MVVETFPFAPLVGDPVKEDFPTSHTHGESMQARRYTNFILLPLGFAKD